jgi:hypothetical protein
MSPKQVPTASAERVEGTLRFSTRNWVILLLGLVAIVAGYALLAQGSTAAAPLLLVLGYVILIPLGIIL